MALIGRSFEEMSSRGNCAPGNSSTRDSDLERRQESEKGETWLGDHTEVSKERLGHVPE